MFGWASSLHLVLLKGIIVLLLTNMLFTIVFCSLAYNFTVHNHSPEAKTCFFIYHYACYALTNLVLKWRFAGPSFDQGPRCSWWRLFPGLPVWREVMLMVVALTNLSSASITIRTKLSPARRLSVIRTVNNRCCRSMCVPPLLCVCTNDFSVANLPVQHGDVSCC